VTEDIILSFFATQLVNDLYQRGHYVT